MQVLKKLGKGTIFLFKAAENATKENRHFDVRSLYLHLAALIVIMALVVAGGLIINFNRSQLQELFMLRYHLIIVSSFAFMSLTGLALFNLKLVRSMAGLAHELKSINDSEDFSNCINCSSFEFVSGLAAEINKTLAKAHAKDEQIKAITDVVYQREQENQLLWLEIEHNLCLAKEDAECDALTGLYNRRTVEQRFEREVEKALANGQSVSVLMCDLDHFKRVNDVYGHQIGDEVLKIFARVLRDSSRVDDVPARYGGEEFIVLLPGASAKSALAVAERIRSNLTTAVAEALPEICDFKCTVSIGMSDLLDSTLNKEDLIARADLALLEAKKSGRDRVVYYGDMKVASAKASESKSA